MEEKGILATHDNHQFTKHRGVYTAKLHRGKNFFQLTDSEQTIESPLLEPMKKIGLDNRAIRRLLSKFTPRLLNEWVDITLAAMERFERSFFSKSPAAYLVDNLNNAAKGTRLPPDWWHDIRKAEELKRAKSARDRRTVEKVGQRFPEKAIASFDDLQDSIFNHFLSGGQNEGAAKDNSERFRAAAKNRK
jgi:hypothetical protein